MNEENRPPVFNPSRALATQQRARRIGQAVSVVSSVIIGLSWFRVVPVSAAWTAFLLSSIASQFIPYTAPPNVARTSMILWGVGLALILSTFIGAPILVGLLGFGISVVGSSYFWFG